MWGRLIFIGLGEDPTPSGVGVIAILLATWYQHHEPRATLLRTPAGADPAILARAGHP